VSLEDENLEELAQEIRKLIDSNKAFLERVSHEEFDLDEEEESAEAGSEEDIEDYEEL